MKQVLSGILVAAAILSAYTFGRCDRVPTGPALEAQGRRPAVPPKTRSEPPTRAPEPLVYPADNGGGAVASNGFIAVTGSYGVGTSVLYLLDTVNKQLTAYEARGGSESMRRLVFVGARRIDLDLQLIDYNDKSEYRREDLARMFKSGPVQAGTEKVTVPGTLAPALGTEGSGSAAEKKGR